MAEITLEAVEQLLDKKLNPIHQTLDRHSVILNQQSVILDGLARDVQKLTDEKDVTVYRLERLEQWAARTGEKVGVKLEL